MIFRPEIGESLTLKFAEAVGERKKRGEEVLSLGLGEPDFQPPKALFNALVKASQNISSHKYSASAGIFPLREKIASELKVHNVINCSAQNIIITPGTKQAIIIALMALLEPDDEVIIIQPSYVSYIPQVYLAEPNAVIKLVNLEKNTYELDWNEFENALNEKTKVVLINSPHNPTGKMMSESDLRKLFQITEKYGTYILSDEIYDKLIFGETEHFSIGSLEKEPTRVVTLNGFGKSLAVTGWRIGYSCIPSIMMGKVIKLMQHINTNTSTLIQATFNEAWPLPYEHLDKYTGKLLERTNLYLDFLSRNPEISGSKPQGSFFAFINISGLNVDSITFTSKLVDLTGVAVTPGIAFGKEWDDHFRISLAVKDNILADAFTRISNFIKNKSWK